MKALQIYRSIFEDATVCCAEQMLEPYSSPIATKVNYLLLNRSMDIPGCLLTPVTSRIDNIRTNLSVDIEDYLDSKKTDSVLGVFVPFLTEGKDALVTIECAGYIFVVKVHGVLSNALKMTIEDYLVNVTKILDELVVSTLQVLDSYTGCAYTEDIKLLSRELQLRTTSHGSQGVIRELHSF